MSVVLAFDVVENDSRKTFRFTENTLAYDINNTGGWNAPNDTTASATEAKLYCFKRKEDGTYDALTGFSPKANMFALGFPSSTLKHTDIPSTTYSFGDVYEDGIYTFTYIVQNGFVWAYTLTKTKIFIGGLRCCFRKMALKYRNQRCQSDFFNCFANEFHLLEYAIDLYENHGQDNLDEIQTYITSLTKKCNGESCKC